MYDSDKVRNDINLLSWYLRHPTWKNEKQSNIAHQEGKFCYKQISCYYLLMSGICIKQKRTSDPFTHDRLTKSFIFRSSF